MHAKHTAQVGMSSLQKLRTRFSAVISNGIKTASYMKKFLCSVQCYVNLRIAMERTIQP